MDKYNELIKDIATLIADQSRQNFLLLHELESTKEQLAEYERRIDDVHAFVEKYDQRSEEAQHA